MSPFCPDPLVDPSVSWETSDPRLTRCMEDTLLAAAPAAAMAAAAALEWAAAAGKDSPRPSSSPSGGEGAMDGRKLYVAKVVLNGVAIVNSACELAFRRVPDLCRGSC